MRKQKNGSTEESLIKCTIKVLDERFGRRTESTRHSGPKQSAYRVVTENNGVSNGQNEEAGGIQWCQLRMRRHKQQVLDRYAIGYVMKKVTSSCAKLERGLLS